MAPDIQQNLFYMLYFLFRHNFEAIFYTLGAATAFIFSMLKPTRALIIIMLGFLILLFSFEYKKHILEPLRQQTSRSLITERPSFRTQRAIDILLAKMIPYVLPILGWVMVGGGIIVELNKTKLLANKDKII